MSEEDYIIKISEGILSEENLELVEISFGKGSKEWRINILAGSNKGLTLKQLTTVSRNINNKIEEDNYFTKDYSLNVSSPGLDRPLTTEADFRRNLEKEIKVIYKDEASFDKNIEMTGIIRKIDFGILTLQKTEGKNKRDKKLLEDIIELDIKNIVKAKIVIRF